MLEKFNSVEELKAYSNAQFNTILDLNKKLNQKDNEIEHLKNLLEKSTEIIETPDNKNKIQTISNLTDQEAICVLQLQILKKRALEQELTLEESKKVETYTKILTAQKRKEDEDNKHLKNMQSDDLLKLLVTDKNE